MHMMNSKVLARTVLTVSLMLLAKPCFAVGNPDDVTILRFHEVTADLYRGAMPQTAGMEQLKTFGIKTDLNIDNNFASSEQERADAERLGINYLYRPLSGFWAPSDQNVNAILAIMNDPANYPIYIHCLHGQDRTGLLVGLYRIDTQGWTPAKAYQEMLDLGFHKALVFLNHYFERTTGFDD